MKNTYTVIILLVTLFITSTVHAVLIDNRDGTITDTDLGIMWLQDANYARTTNYTPDGGMLWSQAVAWADNLVFASYNDWRLQTALNSDGSGPCSGLNCTKSELGHLFYDELGNRAGGPLTNTGPFINLKPSLYWSGTGSATMSNLAWDFDFSTGAQDTYNKDLRIYAFAVRDISSAPPVEPEPVSSVLFILGGSVLGGRIYGKRKRTG